MSRLGQRHWVLRLGVVGALGAICAVLVPCFASASGYGPIEALALSPDGRVLVTADDSGVVSAWNTAGHVKLSVGHLDGVTYPGGISISPTGRTLAAETYSGVELWDVRGKRVLGYLYRTGKDPNAPQVTFSRDGRTVATYRDDTNAVEVWDVGSRKRIGPAIRTPPISLGELALSPNGRTLAVSVESTSSSATSIEFWNVRTGREEGRPIHVDTAVQQVAFSPDGRTIAAVVRASVRFWDVRSRTPRGAPIPDAGGVTYSPDGRTIAIEQGSISLWNARTHLHLGAPFLDHATSVAFSADGRTIAVGDVAGDVRLLKVATGEQFAIYPKEFEDVAFSPDGRTFATATNDGSVRLWDLTTRAPIEPALQVSPYGPLGSSSLAFSQDGQTLATAGSDTRLWNLATQSPTSQVLPGPSGVTQVLFSPDRQTLATVAARYDEEPIRLWNLSTSTSATLPLVDRKNQFYVSSIAFSPDGRTLAVSGSDLSEEGHIFLFDLATRTVVKTFGDLYEHLAFSADGRTLVAGSTLWNVATGAQVSPWFGDSVTQVAFSPDGQTIATADSDGTIRLWNATTHTESGQPLHDDNAAILRLLFSPDGKTLASLGSATVQLWDIASRRAAGPPISADQTD